MTSANDVQTINAIKNHLQSVDNLAAAWLYGSRARGEQTEDSDYDIAIAVNNFQQSYAERRLLPETIAIDLTQQFHVPVQVIDINLAPIPLAINVIEDGTPLLILDELRYCKEISRIEGLWADQRWHLESLQKVTK
ncbi:type VII toxin-antitoxin system MntA family adenylyltransferase antitoxin [Microbulbifer elongatus]|uniref:type VII toxin-antitoxin system MntA family adenylyltransferase antitoxin n=1 Tax=Microbulbifer elongatus TaxID=86173 RepID=UPI001E648097|nr:nucleotidyltransferase domain-containing protein [Microbulbifer elongatus]